MKKAYLEPHVFVFFPDEADILTLSTETSGDGMQISWKNEGYL